MPRPDRSHERRAELIPVIARTFVELGYRRTTTAELARRCGVQETILYRLWPDKKAMFLAAIAAVYEVSQEIWGEVLSAPGSGSPAERLLAYEAEHHGELGLYRILFTGLGETDDPEIRTALKTTYQRFQRWIEDQIVAHRDGRPDARRAEVDAALAAWAVMGLGTVINVGRELELLSAGDRRRLLADVGRVLLEGRTT